MEIFLFIGEHDTDIREDEQRFTATYVVHPQYKNNNGKSLVYDFAILRLNNEVKFTPEISPACLPSVSRRLEGAQGTVVGWGNERVEDREVGVEGLVKGFGYQLSTILQKLDIRCLLIQASLQSYYNSTTSLYQLHIIKPVSENLQ